MLRRQLFACLKHFECGNLDEFKNLITSTPDRVKESYEVFTNKSKIIKKYKRACIRTDDQYIAGGISK
jgi:hypothetical protein